MNIATSPDISVLDFAVTWDISGAAPKIEIENLSVGSGLANVTWWFVVNSPTGTPIHEGDAAHPDKSGTWTDAVLTDGWPRPFNSIEWSGAPYLFTLYVKDSAANVYSLTKQAAICRPYGNTNLSKNAYGKATTDVKVRCQDARVFFQDQTNASYKGIEGQRVSSILKVSYPIDETGYMPDPFSINNFSSALVPITYSSDNYQYQSSVIYEYDFGDNVFVRIKYLDTSRFSVWCNIDLSPLVCEYAKLIEDVERGNCADVQDANQKLLLINPKLQMAMMGIMQPLTGIDVPKLIEEIKEIGGFECDCCAAPTGIIPQTSSVIDGYNFDINVTGGDISGNVSVTGSNITFNLADKSYVFTVSMNSPQAITAFTVSLSISGTVKTYSLNVDGALLAQELLTIIKDTPSLVNLFNSIVVGGGGSGAAGAIVVDGMCVFQSSTACDYTFTLYNIPSSGTSAILSGIKVGNTTYNYGFSFNLTTLAALQTFLNSLNIGTFVVTNPSGQTVVITSTANGSDLQAMSYRIAGTSYLADMNRECAGYVERPTQEVVQDIIYYLCSLTDAGISVEDGYEICYIDDQGVQQVEVIPAGASLKDFLTAVAEKNCQTLLSIKSLASANCENLQAQFGENTLQITANDFIFATKGSGACSRVSFLDAFKYMLTAGMQNAAIKELFAEFVMQTGQGQVCESYEYFDVLVTPYDTSCVSIVGIELELVP